MRVLIADAFEPSGVEGLRELGCEVEHEPDLSGDTLPEALGRLQPEVLMVRSTKVSAEALGAAPVKLVIRAGAGYDTIDVAAASELGIAVAACPGQNSIAVAELAFGLLLALDRRIPENYLALRAGEWKKGEFGKSARGLFGRTLGLVGLGTIGSLMVPRALGFGMDVVAWSRSLTPERADALGVRRAASPEELAAGSDAVSVHLALNDGTRRLLGGPFFTALRPGTLLVNTSRWEVMDPNALRWAVATRGVRYATDVWRDEPASGKGHFRADLVDDMAAIGTQHVGASTEQAQLAVAAEVVRIVGELVAGREVPGVVNGVEP